MLHEIININSIKIGLTAKTKDDLLKEMVDLAGNSNKIRDKEKALKEIMHREEIMSTGIGFGVALPHAKTNVVEDTIVAVGVLAEPIDFQSLDNVPVNIVFLLLGRENNVGLHLKLLSRISHLMNDSEFKEKLLAAKDETTAYYLIKEYDA
jgi:fructose-specific phosphotransferase system IIA component